MLAQALIAAWAAAPTCEPLDAATFRAAVVDAQSAVFRQDIEVATGEIARVTDNVACLDHAPVPRLWADLMVVIAVVNFAEGKDWESPMSAALRIRPNIDRLVGIAHPMYDWEAPPSAPLTPVDTKHEVYIDGQRVSAMPPSDGWYLVQKYDDFGITSKGNWNTTWKRGSSLSYEWLQAPVERPRRLGWEIEIYAPVGIYTGSQTRQNVAPNDQTRSVYDVVAGGEEDPSGYQCPQGRIACGGFVGLAGEIRVTLYSKIGLMMRADYLFGQRPGSRDLHAGTFYIARRWLAGVGFTLFDVPFRRFEVPFVHDFGTVERRWSTADREAQEATLTYAADLRLYPTLVFEGTATPDIRVGARFGMISPTAIYGELGLKLLVRKGVFLDGRLFLGWFLRGGTSMLAQVEAVENRLLIHRAEGGMRLGARFGGIP